MEETSVLTTFGGIDFQTLLMFSHRDSEVVFPTVAQKGHSKERAELLLLRLSVIEV